MHSKELLAQYGAGSRNFRGADLRGQRFDKATLCGIDLTGADLRGTKFNGTDLSDAILEGAKAGPQLPQVCLLIVTGWMLALFATTISTFSGAVVSVFLSPVSLDLSKAPDPLRAWVSNFLMLVAYLALLGVALRNGLRALLTFVALAWAIGVAGAVVGAAMKIWATHPDLAGDWARVGDWAVAWVVPVSRMLAGVGEMAGFIAVNITWATVLASTWTLIGGWAAVLIMITCASAAGYSVSLLCTSVLSFRTGMCASLDGIGVIGLTAREASLAFLGLWTALTIGQRALTGDRRDRLIRRIALIFCSLFGTSFRGARLVGTSFRGATLKGTDFRDAELKHASFRGATDLCSSRFDRAPLDNVAVQRLVSIGANPEASYGHLILSGICLRGLDLRGVCFQCTDLREALLDGGNLEGADLRGANLQGARLKGAILRGANLEAANLRDAQAEDLLLRGAELTDTDLRGTCLARADLTDVTLTHARIDVLTYHRSCWDPAQVVAFRSAGVDIGNPEDYPTLVAERLLCKREGLLLWFNTRLTPIDRTLVELVIQQVARPEADCRMTEYREDGNSAFVRIEAAWRQDIDAVAAALQNRVTETHKDEDRGLVRLFDSQALNAHGPDLDDLRDRLSRIELMISSYGNAEEASLSASPGKARRRFTDRSSSDRALSKRWRPDFQRPLRLFLSYAQADKKFRTEFVKHLISLEQDHLIETWHDGMIAPGQEWEKEARQRLLEADVILPLLSADYLTASSCDEMLRAIERHKAGEVRVVPILLRRVEWRGSPLGGLRALPNDERPVATWKDRDAAWQQIIQGIRGFLRPLEVGEAGSTRKTGAPPRQG